MMWLGSIRRIRLVKVRSISVPISRAIAENNRWLTGLENPGESGRRVREDGVRTGAEFDVESEVWRGEDGFWVSYYYG